jgi:hypothetical protein
MCAAFVRRNLLPLARCIVLVKVIESSMLRHVAAISSSVAAILRDSAWQVLSCLEMAKVRARVNHFALTPRFVLQLFAQCLSPSRCRVQLAIQGSAGGSASPAAAAAAMAERIILTTDVWDKNRLCALDLATKIAMRKVC